MTMDIRIESPARSRRWLPWAAGGGVAAVLIAFALRGGGETGVPTIDGATMVLDTVQRGPLLREVRGSGTLVPEHMRLITALVSARVERVAVLSGAEVANDQVLVEMSNPDVQLQAMQAEQQVSRARIDLLNLRIALRSGILSQEGAVQAAKTQHLKAAQERAVAESLHRQDLIARNDVATRTAEAEESALRLRTEQERLRLLSEAVDSQLDAQRQQIVHLERIAENQRERVRALSLRAPEAGVLQDFSVQLGQWIPEGSTVAKVVRPGALKAMLRIPEVQARDVMIGQEATVDTRDGVVRAKVTRKEAAAVQGSITVDLALLGALPKGAVPDLGVDGVIRLERLGDVLHVGRIGGAAPGGRLSLFRLAPDGRSAERVAVTVGRGSITRMEIVAGLRPGDRIIVSDMSRHEDAERVRIANP